MSEHAVLNANYLRHAIHREAKALVLTISSLMVQTRSSRSISSRYHLVRLMNRSEFQQWM